jgi:hypothetical protein
MCAQRDSVFQPIYLPRSKATQRLSCGCAHFKVQPNRARRSDQSSRTLRTMSSPSTPYGVSSRSPPNSPTSLEEAARILRGRILERWAFRQLSWSSSPLRRNSSGESTKAPDCLTGFVPPTGFLTLSTACSSPERPALFHAGDARGVLLSRDFPSQPGPGSFRRRIALSAFLLTSASGLTAWDVWRPAPAGLSTRGPDHSSPTGLCSGCESVPREDCYIQNPAADSLLSFFTSPGYCPGSMATSRATCSLRRFAFSTAHEPSEQARRSTAYRSGCASAISPSSWDFTLASEISPHEVSRPFVTSAPRTESPIPGALLAR